MDEITWKNYKLEETGKWGPFVCAAPSVGVAVEYALASHGALRYSDVRICETDEEPDPGDRQDGVSKLMFADMSVERAIEELKVHESSVTLLPKNAITTPRYDRTPPK